MNQIKKDVLKSALSGFLVILAFFLGYIFCIKQHSLHEQNRETKYVEILTKKNSIEIAKVPIGVEVVVNGNITQSGSIELK